MEFKRVERPVRYPGCCTLCRTADVPCAEVEVEFIDVPTAAGPLTVEGFVYLCLDRPGYVGCASQAARLGGALDQQQAQALRDRLDQAEREILKLREQSSDRPLVVVSAEELMEKMAFANPAA